MKKALFLFLLSLFGRNPSNDGITYRPLAWSDFRLEPSQTETSVAARTTTQLAMEVTELDGRVNYRVKAYFLPDSSFVRVRSDQNLRHEQMHFLIAYIASLRCMQELLPYQGKESSLQNKAQSVYDKWFDAAANRQDQFDRETNHSLNREAEQKWEALLSREIHILETHLPKLHGRN